MIFTVSDRPIHKYDHIYPITDKWSLYSVEKCKNGLLGYRLHEHGGNFLQVSKHIDGTKIQWSFYQDRSLTQDLEHGILLSNDPDISTNCLRTDTIGLTISSDAISFDFMDWRPWLRSCLSPDQVLKKISDRLSANLAHCLSQAEIPHKIVFTGGLDSGLLAFMALIQNREFQCVINTKHMNLWPDLPFPNIIYRNSSTRKDLHPDQSVKESYYGRDMNDCITGFFGDVAMMHNTTLYHQCEKLDSPKVTLYDRSPPDAAPMFSNQFQVRQAAINIMRAARFRQWFPDFRILDPYRDPGITQLVLSLPWRELCSQFGSAWIQRKIVDTMDTTWCRFLLQHKNEYPG